MPVAFATGGALIFKQKSSNLGQCQVKYRVVGPQNWVSSATFIESWMLLLYPLPVPRITEVKQF